MNTLKIHHIGYLVKKIKPAIIAFKNLGFNLKQDITHDAIREVDICFMEKDDYLIELVSPTTTSSVVAGLIKKLKNCPYHICYESDNFTEDLARLSQQGYLIIDMPTPAPAINNQQVVFLMNASLGMIELLEKE